MAPKNKSELVRQIEAYGLKGKLADLARREESKRPFHHLPKQFSKGISCTRFFHSPRTTVFCASTRFQMAVATAAMLSKAVVYGR